MKASWTIEDGPDGRTLVVTGDWSRATQKRLVKGDVDGLTLNYALGFRERTLDFLDGWPIRRLSLLARTIKDLSPIYRLAGTLRHLNVEADDRATLDLSRLPSLSALSGQWDSIKASVHLARNLEDLFALGYDSDDLGPLTSLTLLKRLRLKDRPRVRSLVGTHQLKELRLLGIYGAASLDDLSPLRTDPQPAGPCLDSLHLEACRRIDRIDDLAGQPNLTTLSIADCGEIQSLHPLVGMTRLRSLHAWGDTRILDDDLSPLLALPMLAEIRMKERRSYRPSLAEVRSQAGILD